MKMGEEVLLKARVIGLENGSTGSRTKVEIAGFEVEIKEDLREKKGIIRFWTREPIISVSEKK